MKGVEFRILDFSAATVDTSKVWNIEIFTSNGQRVKKRVKAPSTLVGLFKGRLNSLDHPYRSHIHQFSTLQQ
jgi:hypothetical protein